MSLVNQPFPRIQLQGKIGNLCRYFLMELNILINSFEYVIAKGKRKKFPDKGHYNSRKRPQVV